VNCWLAPAGSFINPRTSVIMLAIAARAIVQLLP